jgi:hypothetical protein
MGGGLSSELSVTGEATPHRAKLSWGGKPVKGGFSAGPRTMEKIRTRSDFCLLKIVEQEVVRKVSGRLVLCAHSKYSAVFFMF